MATHAIIVWLSWQAYNPLKPWDKNGRKVPLNLIEENMTETLSRAIEIIVRVVDPKRIILFGSRAKEENHSESDYDLLILKEGVKFPRKLAQQIYLNFSQMKSPIDLIVVDLEKYEDLKNDPYLIYNEAAQHGRVIYERPEQDEET